MGAVLGSLFMATIVFPSVAAAGVFSFFAELFSDRDERAQAASVGNAQTMALLEAARNRDPNPSKGGGDITIVGGTALLPETGPSGTIANIEDTPLAGEISIYVVREGDSLSAISKMFGVSVNTIVWANDIKNAIIRPGDRLVILPVSGVQHTVKKGETIQSIALKYKADLAEVLQFNDLQPGAELAIGSTVIIPDAELAAPILTMPSRVRGAGGPSYDGYYLRPVAGARKTQGLHGYNGIDLGAPEGTPVLAAASGQVIISRNYGWNGGYGNYVAIEHGNGTQTLYSHLSLNAVFEGFHVARGQIIGYVGQTGKVTGPHLHFEVRGARNPF
ncbi:MAG: peptidase M23 family protein [Parcubacteria group bacterium Gr01-1014_72]|nr:MAG: peptidase M23 family protein [Parcubacteria group bacterium Gr01-1014_72]